MTGSAVTATNIERKAMETIAIFRKGDAPDVQSIAESIGVTIGKNAKKLTEHQVDDVIDAMVDEGKIRKVRRKVIHAMLDGTFAKLPPVTQHEIDKTNGPRKLLEQGKGWEIPEEEFGASGLSDSTVISIKRYLEKSLGIPAATFSVCRIHGRSAIELGE